MRAPRGIPGGDLPGGDLPGGDNVTLMRVVAGEARGRRLVAPAGTDTRPTADRVREAMFNSLDSLGVIDDAKVLDLFAGTGALGIEALSRGAAFATFVERSRPAVEAVRTNLAGCRFEARSRVIPADQANVELAGYDLVLADPPYGFAGWDDIFERATGAFVVAEASVAVTPPDGWSMVRQVRYGKTWVTFAQPS